ncbi:hypothetical protein JZ751_010806 [Albula glossodonta]|uniref:ERC protein 2 n=1 Tax=Albula glossodonta TaxID=121402 RepID=A0A8T2N2C1_9TELE|nr:hypothetical protein JZ751_010806 [Albula glossodonta]
MFPAVLPVILQLCIYHALCEAQLHALAARSAASAPGNEPGDDLTDDVSKPTAKDSVFLRTVSVTMETRHVRKGDITKAELLQFATGARLAPTPCMALSERMSVLFTELAIAHLALCAPRVLGCCKRPELSGGYTVPLFAALLPIGPRLHREPCTGAPGQSPRLGHRRGNSGSGGGAGKTLSMENIQSLNAAYATSGPMYLSDHEGVASTTYPKGTMTLGRATSRAMYGGRVTAMGSSPNIASVGLQHADLLSYGDHGSFSMLHHHGLHHQAPPSGLQRQQQQAARDGALLDMQSQMRELQRENELLRRELDLKDSKLGSSTNSIKTFWSPELKKERVMRREEAARMSVLKEQMRVTHEENQFAIAKMHDAAPVPEGPLFHLSLKGPLFHLSLRGPCFTYPNGTPVSPVPEGPLFHLSLRGPTFLCFYCSFVAPCIPISQRPPVSSISFEALFISSRSRVQLCDHYSTLLPSGPESSSLTTTPHSSSGPESFRRPRCGGRGLNPDRSLSGRPQHLQLTIQALQDELRTQRDLNHLLQQESSSRGAEHFTFELTEENFRRLQAEHERQAKELFLLRKTLEEMELRIETQKQTLSARDESIKKLLEMLQSKGLPSGRALEEESERARRVAQAEAQVSHMELILDQKEKENIHLREELHRRTQLHQDPSKTKALQTVIEMKDTKIASLERNIRDLEDELQMLKTNGLLNTEEREEELKQMEVYKNHSKFMKSKIDQLKQELSKKESELLALQTKLETLNNQNSDCKQHIEVLKESLTAKEQRAAILQTEVDALRLRLEEKESFLNKKSKQLQELTEEKGTLAGEIHDMKDMLEVKERKVNVLQKKIENLLEQLRDKDKQLSNLKDRVKSLQTDSSNTDTALATLEEALSEKERIIERLKEQREREDRERLEETESYKRENKDLKERVGALQAELTEKEPGSERHSVSSQSSLIDLKEHASSLASSGLKKDSKLKSLEIAIEQKKEECNKLETQLQKAHEVEQIPRGPPEMTDRVKMLEKEVAYFKEESGKAHAEVDRLLDILREVETEKNDKDKRISELERQELESTKQRLSSTQQSLAERDGHLTNLRQERRKQLEEILEMKQQALLAAISEKDANIALLELSASNRKKTQEEVLVLKREKDRLMHQLKQQPDEAHC